MVSLNLFKNKKDKETANGRGDKAVSKEETEKVVTPHSSPRGRQKPRDDTNNVSPTSPGHHHRSHAPHHRTISKSAVKSDRDLYNDLLEDATGNQNSNHTSNSSNSSLELDGLNNSRTLEYDGYSSAPKSPVKSPKRVIVDSTLQAPRPKSPGHTGHERRQKFTFVGDMLVEDGLKGALSDDDDDGVDEFGEEREEDILEERLLGNPTSTLLQTIVQPPKLQQQQEAEEGAEERKRPTEKIVKPTPQRPSSESGSGQHHRHHHQHHHSSKKAPGPKSPSKPKRKTSSARCDAV